MEELSNSVKNHILEAVRARRHGLRLTPEEESLIHDYLKMVPVESERVELLIEKCIELVPVVGETNTETRHATREATSDPRAG